MHMTRMPKKTHWLFSKLCSIYAGSKYWFCPKVVCSTLYVNTNKICRMLKNPLVYTVWEEILSMHLTGLPCLLFPTMQCTAKLQPNLVGHLLLKANEKEKKKILLLLPVCGKCILSSLPVYCSVNRHTDCSFSILYVEQYAVCSMY